MSNVLTLPEPQSDWIPRITNGHNTADLLCFGLHDCDNAQRLIKLKGSDLRFCHPFKKWLVWDERRWMTDVTDQARKIAQEAMLEFLRQAITANSEPGQKFARQSLDSRRLTAMLHEARPHLVVTPDELDTDPDLLNFANGTVNLRTGELRPPHRGDLITKVIHYPYDPDATCPLFLRFLYRIMGDGPDASEVQRERAEQLVAYLQTALGYSLTGHTIEKVVFLLHGGGNNGKTTLLSLFLKILQEYAVLLQIDTLMIRRESNNTQADLADLRGARFVMTSETEEGQRLAEGKLKRITQGMGKIKAVRKYENPIEFRETHKLWMDCNHKPRIKGTDNAIWNRLHPIPFNLTIPAEEIDRDLPQKLIGEAPGILAWAVAGARLWYADGLQHPGEVEQAKSEWRDEMDQIGRFIDDCCITGEYAQAKADPLYSSYKQWTARGGEDAMPMKDFSVKVTEHGFRKKHSDSGNLYLGVGLRPAES